MIPNQTKFDTLNKHNVMKTANYNEFKVLKISAGYTIKTFKAYETAKKYSEKCCKVNNNCDFTVCVWEGGRLVEI